MFGTRRTRWGSLAKIGSPLCVLGAATTQQLLPIAGPGSKGLPDRFALDTIRSWFVSSGNLPSAVRRSKSLSFGKGAGEPGSLPSSGVSQEENLGAKNSKALGGKALLSASNAS